MLNRTMLLNAISERENGKMPNFSQITLNNAVDLVLFEGYSIDAVLNMNECEIDMLNDDDYYEEPEIISSYKCPHCDGEMIENFVDCESDGACDVIWCTCKACGKQHRFFDYGMCFDDEE